MLTPVAWPVSSAVTASTIRFGIAANASPMPIDITRFHTTISAWVSWTSAIIVSPNEVMIAPSASGRREPKRVPSTPGERAGDEHHQRAGDHQEAGAGGVEAEAVAGRRRAPRRAAG